MPCAVNYAESKGAVLTTVIYHVIILYSRADKITFLGGKYKKTQHYSRGTFNRFNSGKRFCG